MYNFRYVPLFSAALLTFALAGCASGSSQETTQAVQTAPAEEAGEESTTAEEESTGKIADDYVLKVGETQGALCHAPLQAAMELGYLDEEGINWERVDFGGGDIQAALGSGTIDCGFGLVGKFIQPIENGLNMVITSGMHTGCTKLLVRADSGITDLEGLKGKTIGVTSLAGSEAVTTRRSLYKAGFDISAGSEDISFVVYSNADLPAALMNGAIDGIAVPDPVATTAEVEYGLVALIDTATDDAYKDEYCCISFVSAEIAEEHPEIAAAFTRAVLKGSAWVAAHTEEAAQLQIDKEYVAGDLELNTKILKSYKFVPSVQGGYDALVNVSHDLQTIGVLRESTDVDAMIERSFAYFEGVPDSYDIVDGEFVPVG